MRAGLLKAIRMESTRGVDSPKNARVLDAGWAGDAGLEPAGHRMVEGARNKPGASCRPSHHTLFSGFAALGAWSPLPVNGEGRSAQLG